MTFVAGALSGLLILDLTRVLAGPWATQIFADLGARVIKIENPAGGDETRQWGPPFFAPGLSAYFACANRNKESLALDLARPEGAAVARALAAQADALIENFRADSLDKFGLDFASLRKINPRLVYCSLRGFARSTPRAAQPGYDALIQAMGGLMSVTGATDGAPTKVGVALADIVAGLNAAVGVLAALRRRDQCGRGQRLEVALFDSQVAALANQALNYLASSEPPRRMGDAHPNIAPYESFATADKPLMIAVGNDDQFARLCRVVAPDLAADKRFADNAARVKNRAALHRALQKSFLARKRDDWIARLEAAQTPVGAINDLEEVFADPAAAHLRVSIPAAIDGGAIPGVANPVALEETPPQYRAPPPALGAHTREILRATLGFSDSKIDGLIKKGAVQCAP